MEISDESIPPGSSQPSYVRKHETPAQKSASHNTAPTLFYIYSIFIFSLNFITIFSTGYQFYQSPFANYWPMFRSCIIVLVTFIIVNTSFAQSSPAGKKDSLQAVIIHLFGALSDLDTAKAKACCTSDIIILESGQVWNFDSLAVRISTRKAKSPDFKRVNRFDFIETKVFKGLGYVSYFNYATISFSGKTTSVKWIETAVLRQEANRWKIALLHSTELERTP